MNVRKVHCILFIMMLLYVSSWAQSTIESKPAWLDTIPPIVSVAPRDKLHNKVFSMSLISSERGTIWYGLRSKEQLKQYKKPLSFTRDGLYTVYFYAEDDFGNKSVIDSLQYILDTKPPEFSISPESGAFRQPTYLYVSSTEHCTYTLLKKVTDSTGVSFKDSILIRTPEPFWVKATDEAGNKTTS